MFTSAFTVNMLPSMAVIILMCTWQASPRDDSSSASQHLWRLYLPATTIFSCLPVRACSLLGTWVFSVIVVSAQANPLQQPQLSAHRPGRHFRDASGKARARCYVPGRMGGERKEKTCYGYEYSWHVCNVVRCILTSQGVNMTLAQKPAEHRVRERN